MLCGWIFDGGRILKQHKWLGGFKYCTKAATIESVLRSELSKFVETMKKKLIFYNMYKSFFFSK